MNQQRHILSVRGEQTLLDERLFLVKGLRCSNALLSEAATHDLIAHLGIFAGYGANTISVFFQGSRFGDIKGYQADGTLNEVYAARMGRIIEAADALSMIVLVGCLYWGDSRARWAHWTQTEANAAVKNTVRWLHDNGYRNVIVDVDNEGMGLYKSGFDNRQMVIAGKEANPDCVIGTNFHGPPPPEADLGLHFATPVAGKPYIQSEGSPPDVPGGYWGPFSKQAGLYQYLNVGIYTQMFRERQIADARMHLERGWGYMLASTWLQAPPPLGPNHRPGGMGTVNDPGIRWWLEWLRDEYKT